MSKEVKYFDFYFSEDGDYSVSIRTKEQIEKDLNEDYGEGVGVPNIIDGDKDLCSQHGHLIIKGVQVFPKPTKIVERYTLD